MKSKLERPSTANTMLLVLKPREEEYKNLMPLTGSEKEREAWRKNRVIQMKLGAYLAEVRLQQKSTARLFKTEECRFLQEVSRRSNVPRSVMMLQQLQLYKEKTFPGAGYSYGHQILPSVSGRERLSNLHKHTPLSARNPARSRPHQSLLDRPQTSASVFRKSLEDRDAEIEDADVLYGKGDSNHQPESSNRAIVVEEKIYSLGDSDFKPQQFQNRHVTEFPSIQRSRETNSGENLKREVTLPDEGSANYSPSVSIIPSGKVETDSSEFLRKNSVSLERRNSSSKLSMTLKQKRDALSRSASLSKIPAVGKFNTKDGPIHEEDRPRDPSNSDDSFEVDTKLEELLADEIRAFENEEAGESAEVNDDVFGENDPSNGKEETEDEKLGIIDLDAFENSEGPFSLEKPDTFMKSTKASKVKTNFNRLKAEPVMPLRHNITSVLRQERTRYEASQTKIKDYLHKMTSRDFMTKGQNARDTTSAQSRKSSAKK
ncbi:uncharacterized protein LOC106012524 [Aplysia californica]|uniref:Uncharacterized protein LOC106012524 n=1 Tax=Aplysia californica TaxID=6500 RepID=A0ABM1A5D3_APLCA|nr:uncharacterized protein LOC106012524 [Aplysia californica]